VGGQDKIRVLWRHYYSEIKGLIFVVDSSNFDRLDQAREVLHQILLDKELEDAVLLVYANKCDIAVASVAAIQEKLELNEIKNRKWYI
jgi:GTPase SAR1 family protein